MGRLLLGALQQWPQPGSKNNRNEFDVIILQRSLLEAIKFYPLIGSKSCTLMP
jgi:hypothetical protein